MILLILSGIFFVIRMSARTNQELPTIATAPTRYWFELHVSEPLVVQDEYPAMTSRNS